MEFLSQVIHNTTVPAHLAQASASSPLYSSVDFASLNVFEQLWGPSSLSLSAPRALPSPKLTFNLVLFRLPAARWYMWIGNPVLATGIMSFVLHEVRFLLQRLIDLSLRSGRARSFPIRPTTKD